MLTNSILATVVFLSFTYAEAHIHLSESFDSMSDFEQSWIESTVNKSDGSAYEGQWILEQVPTKVETDLCLKTKSEAAHYSISKKLTKPFDFSSSERFLFQYSFKIDPEFSCGGAYVKLYSDLPENSKMNSINDKSRYSIMFGPDKCGSTNMKIHFIFQHLNPITKLYEEKHCSQPAESSFSHIFSDGNFHNLRLILLPDNSFQMFLDSNLIHSGSLLTSFTPVVNPPETIPDPKDVKPSDWDDRKEIDDPKDSKPSDWDETQPSDIKDVNAKMPAGWLPDAPLTIPDPNVSQPEEWDSEIDGEWIAPHIENPACSVGCGVWLAPFIPNPKYKGKWFPRRIANPAYKGEFKPKQIPNPEYFLDQHPYKMASISSIGLELWILAKSVIFDDFIFTDSIKEADAFHSNTWKGKQQFSMKAYLKANLKTALVTLAMIVVGTFALCYKLFTRNSSKVDVSTTTLDDSVLSQKSDIATETHDKSDSLSDDQSDSEEQTQVSSASSSEEDDDDDTSKSSEAEEEEITKAEADIRTRTSPRKRAETRAAKTSS